MGRRALDGFEDELTPFELDPLIHAVARIPHAPARAKLRTLLQSGPNPPPRA